MVCGAPNKQDERQVGGEKPTVKGSSQAAGRGEKEAHGESGFWQCVFSARLPVERLAGHTEQKASRARRSSSTGLGGPATAMHCQIRAENDLDRLNEMSKMKSKRTKPKVVHWVPKPNSAKY